MKLLVGIVSCERDRVTHQAVRETWLRFMPSEVDYKFLLGWSEGFQPEPDELLLQCGDSYQELTYKAYAFFRYALRNAYTHVLHVGRDTYVNVPRLVRAGLDEFDYAGHSTDPRKDKSEAYDVPLEPNEIGRYPFASGGAGSFLSARSMTTLLNSSLYHPCDDLLMGWALGQAGISLRHDPRFGHHGDCLYDEKQFTIHLSKGTGNYDPLQMYKAHKLSCQFGRMY